MRCSLGAKCFKEDPGHKKEFAHPTDADWDQAEAPPEVAMWACSNCGVKSPESYKFCGKCMAPR